MEKTITINTTPVKTWYWLGLNDVKIKWAEGETVEKNISSGKAEIKSEKDYTHQKLNITGNRDSVIFLNIYADKNLWIDTEISGDKNVLFKLKALWIYLGMSFTNPQKYLKKIKKANRLAEYEEAVDALFREQELIL